MKSQVSSIVLPALGARVGRGEVACWLGQGTALVPIRSPVAGDVLLRNPRIARCPELVLSSPYEDGWLFEVEVAPGDDGGLLDAAAARERAREQVDSIRRRAARYLRAGAVDVGPTAADGGS